MRYFFHIVLVDGQIDDEDGSLFDTLQEAKDEARSALAELAAEAIFGRSMGAVSIKIWSETEEVAVVAIDPAVEKAFTAASVKRDN